MDPVAVHRAFLAEHQGERDKVCDLCTRLGVGNGAGPVYGPCPAYLMAYDLLQVLLRRAPLRVVR